MHSPEGQLGGSYLLPSGGKRDGSEKYIMMHFFRVCVFCFVIFAEFLVLLCASCLLK